MATVSITWRGIHPISPLELAFDVQWALDNDYPVHIWDDRTATGQPVTLTRVDTPSGAALALYETVNQAHAVSAT